MIPENLKWVGSSKLSGIVPWRWNYHEMKRTQKYHMPFNSIWQLANKDWHVANSLKAGGGHVVQAREGERQPVQTGKVHGYYIWPTLDLYCKTGWTKLSD